MKRKLTIWDEMQRMQDEMDLMFNRFWTYDPYRERPLLNGPKNNSNKTEISRYRQPLTDIWETDKEVIATLELPGVSKEDININVKDDRLEVKVEKKQEKDDKKEGSYRFERSYSGFYRCFSLPSHVKADATDATYKNGVLEIKIPKLKEIESKSKKIEVK
ncbi:Hsp20/alpha crystallin family protein [Candidatus Woesearchaeota archaeon]|nr:Hsp20/alpha crystallin family protein [Candidatus Woesearchaeota archaeon]